MAAKVFVYMVIAEAGSAECYFGLQAAILTALTPPAVENPPPAIGLFQTATT
ncbi:MAG: hypothetical protein ACOYVF_00900 [Candidatus Zixiibacteriota bacterium]